MSEPKELSFENIQSNNNGTTNDDTDSRSSAPMKRMQSMNENPGLMKSATQTLEDGKLTRAMTLAIEGGFSRTTKKATWPFDVYQASNYFPVDYHYWQHEYQSDIGDTHLTMVHPVKWTEDAQELAADYVVMREKQHQAHLRSTAGIYKMIGLDLDPQRQCRPLNFEANEWIALLLEENYVGGSNANVKKGASGITMARATTFKSGNFETRTQTNPIPLEQSSSE